MERNAHEEADFVRYWQSIPGVDQVRVKEDETDLMRPDAGHAPSDWRHPCHYLWRGPITVHAPLTGHLIERFTTVERAVHWTVAIAFATLAITGLILTLGKTVLLPLIGYTLFSWLAILSKTLHNFVGPVLVVALPIMIVLFMHENFFRAYDWLWLKKGGGMLTGEHVPSGKANAGQKILFWLMVVAFGLTLCVTGLILDFPNFNTADLDAPRLGRAIENSQQRRVDALS